ncbi:MAG: AI-2E family transporter [candidate division Zixibacteria bacterium]|nr:AI-2E family transporter [candidate division Zixibacteria bacterium]
MANNTKSYLTLQNIALPFIALAAATAFFYFASPILIPVVLAASFSYILSPAVKLLNRIKLPHLVSVFIVVLVAILVIAIAGYFLFGIAQGLVGDFPNYWDAVVKFLSQTRQDIKILDKILPSQESLDLRTLQLKDVSGLTRFIAKSAGSLFTFIFISILTVFLTILLLSEQKGLKEKLIYAFGKNERSVAENIIAQINRQIGKFLVVRFLTSLGLGIAFAIGLAIIGVKYAIFWGLLAGVMDLVPFIGPVLAVVPPLIVTGVQFKSVMPMFWVFILYEAIQIPESNLIAPRLMGRSLNLSPFALLVATMYWAWLWGAIGVILAIPITAAMKVICDHIEPLEPIGILLGGKVEKEVS